MIVGPPYESRLLPRQASYRVRTAHVGDSMVVCAQRTTRTERWKATARSRGRSTDQGTGVHWFGLGVGVRQCLGLVGFCSWTARFC